MTAIPTWIRGRDVQSVVLTGQTVAADGTLTNGSSPAAQTVTASLAFVRVSQRPQKDNVSPVTSPRANNVIGEDDSQTEIGLLINGSGVTNPLATLCAAYDIIKLVFQRKITGASTTGDTWTHYASRGDFDEVIDSKTKNLTTLVIDQVDIGSAPLAYA